MFKKGNKKQHNFSKKELEYLYLKKKLNIEQIALKKGCCMSTLWNNLKKYNIPRRFRVGNIPKKILKDLYVNEKLSSHKIAKKLKTSQHTIMSWLKIHNISLRGIHKFKKGNKFYNSLNSIKTRFRKGQHPSQKTEFKKGNIHYSKGKTAKEDNRILAGEKHPNFNNWSSREPYGQEFSPGLKKKIRKKYNHRCQQCFRHQNELITNSGKRYKLAIHHIDYNKQNNSEDNLVPLCRNCHSQTNFKRKDWTKYFQNKLMEGLI